MPRTAAGTFEVQLAPQAPEGASGEGGVGRLVIDKVFHGDLEAASHGQMLGYRSAVEGSAGYVAMERVDGELEGRAGTFVLQHSATMEGGEANQTIQVIPGSGTGALAGLSGSMTIDVEEDVHRYTLTYSLAE